MLGTTPLLVSSLTTLLLLFLSDTLLVPNRKAARSSKRKDGGGTPSGSLVGQGCAPPPVSGQRGCGRPCSADVAQHACCKVPTSWKRRRHGCVWLSLSACLAAAGRCLRLKPRLWSSVHVSSEANLRHVYSEATRRPAQHAVCHTPPPCGACCLRNNQSVTRWCMVCRQLDSHMLMRVDLSHHFSWNNAVA